MSSQVPRLRVGTSWGWGRRGALFYLLHTEKNGPMDKSITKLEDKNCHKPQNKKQETGCGVGGRENQQLQSLRHISIYTEEAEEDGRVSDAPENTRTPKSLVDTHWEEQWATLRSVAELRELEVQGDDRSMQWSMERQGRSGLHEILKWTNGNARPG